MIFSEKDSILPDELVNDKKNHDETPQQLSLF